MILFPPFLRLRGGVGDLIRSLTHFEKEIRKVKVNTLAKRTFFALLLLGQLLLIKVVSQAQPYQVVNTENSIIGGDLNETVTTVQEGNNALDRFFMIKVVTSTSNEPLKAVMLLLPPLGSGFQNYEVGENGNYNKSFVAHFARRNVAVVGYSPRVHGLAAGSGESGVIDSSPMQLGPANNARRHRIHPRVRSRSSFRAST